MFRKSRRKRTSSVDTLVGRNTRIQGQINFTGGLHIDGEVRGDVISDGDPEAVLSVSEYGKVEGEIIVPNIVLSGEVVGDVYADERVELASVARVTGDVYYNMVEMAGGATVNGNMVRRPKQNRVLALEYSKGGDAAPGEGSGAAPLDQTAAEQPQSGFTDAGDDKRNPDRSTAHS